MNKMKYFLALLLFLTVISSCRQNKSTPEKKQTKTEAIATLERINRVLIQEDRELIEGYIKRNKLEDIKETGTGLFYLIWGESNGDFIKSGDIIEYNYKISLLDGTLCYESKPNSPGKFMVGHGGVESGLEQGVLMMKPGQKAKFIIPPFLAHGLIGDADRIPARAIIVYDIELLSVNP